MSTVAIGSQIARIELIPDGDEHPLWSEVVDFVDALGITLDEWQWRVLKAALLRRGDVWAAFAVAVCAPRQNGKNGILEVRELAGAYILGEKLQIHTAHLADTSKEGFRRLDDLLDANEWLSRDVKHIWRTNGHESIEFTRGRRIRFRTRTRGGGRGFSGSPVYFDEPMFLPLISMGAILPVISAQPDPQVWYTGSAVDQEKMEDGIQFARVRERALKGDDPRLAYFEWSLDYALPDQVPSDLDLADVAIANPALGIRISPDYVVAEHKELDPRSFAVERLGVGDWPRTDGLGDLVIHPDVWNALEDDEELEEPLCLVFDVTPDRRKGAIAGVGRRADDLLQGEVIEHKAGTGWIVPSILELRQRSLLPVVCDDIGPAASLIPELEQAGVTVERVNGPTHAQSCGLFYDAVEEGRFRHRGDPRLLAAIKGGVKRPLGERWAWSRKNSSVDISPLVAVTLGVGYVLTHEPARPMVAFV